MEEILDLMVEFWYCTVIAVISVLVIIVAVTIGIKNSIKDKKMKKENAMKQTEDKGVDDKKIELEDKHAIEEENKKIEEKDTNADVMGIGDEEKIIEEPKVENAPVVTPKSNIKQQPKEQPSEEDIANKEAEMNKKQKVTKTAPKKTAPKKETIKKAEPKKEVSKKAEPKKVVKKNEEKPVEKKEDSANKKPTYSVLYDKVKKEWIVKKIGSTRATKRLPTKEEALKYAKELSEMQDVNILVHKKDGKFQKKSNVNL